MALGVLAGATLAVGAAAAVAFPEMKALDPTLGAYANWPDEHWPIAAGAIANRLFRMLDWASLAIVFFVVLTCVPKSSRPSGRGGIVFWIAIGGLAMVMTLNWLWLRPEMHQFLMAYWSSAQQGNLETGRAAREAFNELHPTASAMLQAQLLLALTGAAFASPGRARVQE